MNTFTVAFFGHRYITNAIKVQNLLEEQIYKLLQEKEYIEFLVGRNGDFDQYTASAVRIMRKKCDYANSTLVLVLPYDTAEYVSNKESFENYYDEIEISYKASKSHPKNAIIIRNKEIIERADLIICFVERKGGAQQAVEYAKYLGKSVINIADLLL